MKRKIQIWDYVFDIEITDDTSQSIVGLKFHMLGRKADDFTEDEYKRGLMYKRDIFGGKWTWLILKDRIITLPTHNILLNVLDPIYNGTSITKYGGGTISSCLKETCPHCQDTDCDFDCPESCEDSSKVKETRSRLAYNFACDAIEAMVLSQALAGLDIESPEYLDSLNSAIDAVANNI